MKKSLLLLPLLVSCAQKNVEIPSEIKTSGKKSEINWSKSLRKQDPLVFAPFQTTKLEIDWESGSSTGFSVGGIGGGKRQSEQAYRFVLTKAGASATADVDCKKTASQSGVSVVGISTGEAKADLSCKFANGGELHSVITTDGGVSGSVKGLKTGEISFAPIYTDESGSLARNPLGYQLSLNDKPLAALNLGREKSYWFIEQNEALDVDLAATAAAIFFLNP